MLTKLGHSILLSSGANMFGVPVEDTIGLSFMALIPVTVKVPFFIFFLSFRIAVIIIPETVKVFFIGHLVRCAGIVFLILFFAALSWCGSTLGNNVWQ